MLLHSSIEFCLRDWLKCCMSPASRRPESCRAQHYLLQLCAEPRARAVPDGIIRIVSSWHVLVLFDRNKQGRKWNKSAQSNLEKGPRCGAVAHVRHKVPIGYNGGPHIRPQKYPFPWTDPQPPLYLLHPWTRLAYDAKRLPDPIRRFPQCT